MSASELLSPSNVSPSLETTPLRDRSDIINDDVQQTKHSIKSSSSSSSFSCFRNFRAITVLSFLTSSAFIILLCLGPVTFFLLRLFSVHQSRRLNSFFFSFWLAMWPYLFEKVNKTKVNFVMDNKTEGCDKYDHCDGGDDDDDEEEEEEEEEKEENMAIKERERVLLMCNHRTEVDWMYIWNLALRKGRIGHVKYVLKNSVRNVPVFGWSFHLLEFLLVERNWQTDERAFISLLSTFKDPIDPLWLVIFPEGTDYTDEKCARSQKYAEEHSLPKLEHVLLPRTKGFYACVDQLRGSIDAVYDLTIGYKTPLPLFMDNAVGTNPKEVHIHIKRIPISDIPLSETEVSTWLVNAFSSKDELLRHFYKEGVFPGTPVEGELSTISGLLNFFAILICTGLLLWFMLIPSVWIRVYLAFSFLLLVGSTYFGYKPKSLFGTRFQC